MNKVGSKAYNVLRHVLPHKSYLFANVSPHAHKVAPSLDFRVSCRKCFSLAAYELRQLGMNLRTELGLPRSQDTSQDLCSYSWPISVELWNLEPFQGRHCLLCCWGDLGHSSWVPDFRRQLPKALNHILSSAVAPMFFCWVIKHQVLAFHLSPKLPRWVPRKLGSTVRMATCEYKHGFARAWELTPVPEKALPNLRSFRQKMQPWEIC